MKNIIFIAILIFTCTFYSCKKDKESETPIKIEEPKQNFNIISNGNFENLLSNKSPKDWTVVENNMGNSENFIKIDSIIFFEGNYSLNFHHADSVGCWEMWINQTIDSSKFEAGNYTLNFNYKSNFNYNNGFEILLRNSTKDLRYYPPINFINDSSWHQLSYNFNITDDFLHSDLDLYIHFCIPVKNSWWIDNIIVKKTE